MGVLAAEQVAKKPEPDKQPIAEQKKEEPKPAAQQQPAIKGKPAPDTNYDPKKDYALTK